MSDSSLVEVATAIAAVVSAVGGAFAAVAAFRSAGTAREATQTAVDLNRRAMLRDVSSTAGSILVAIMGVSSRAAELIVEYKSAGVFSGSANNSSLRNLIEITHSLKDKAENYGADAELFAKGAIRLAEAPMEEIDRVLIRLTSNYQEVQAIREELDSKYTAIATQNMQHREIALKSNPQ